MASAQARAAHESNGRPVLFIDKRGRPRWSEVWDGNPRIVRGAVNGAQVIVNGPGARPYIAGKTPTRWIWAADFACTPGEIYLSDAERAAAERWRGYVLIEPNIKPRPEAINKAWIRSRWQHLVDTVGADFVQAGPPDTALLAGVRHATTATFREACAVLSVCRAYVGTEGGLHHAAAALGVPAVVLFSGFISPKTTGYAAHRNIYHGGIACGARLPCLHCRESMERINVVEVADNIMEILW